MPGPHQKALARGDNGAILMTFDFQDDVSVTNVFVAAVRFTVAKNPEAVDLRITRDLLEVSPQPAISFA